MMISGIHIQLDFEPQLRLLYHHDPVIVGMFDRKVNKLCQPLSYVFCYPAFCLGNAFNFFKSALWPRSTTAANNSNFEGQ